MNKKHAFEKERSRRQNLWDTTWITLIVVVVIGAGVSANQNIGISFSESPSVFTLLMLLSVAIAGGFALSVLRPVNSYLEKTWLKKYWMETCESSGIVKVHGSIPLRDFDRVWFIHLKCHLLNHSGTHLEGVNMQLGDILGFELGKPRDSQTRKALAEELIRWLMLLTLMIGLASSLA
ncbi:hypothetical protein [Marinobacterium jannaschii]|uniref:hypothetical protein n=1 Tax=Marinobacterium jannaschii TaxID=64970 RepID=UPI000480B208|nr:hypothetical protein [Marinobacterium jannaschii]